MQHRRSRMTSATVGSGSSRWLNIRARPSAGGERTLSDGFGWPPFDSTACPAPKKRGSRRDSPFGCYSGPELERVSPVKVCIGPVSTFAATGCSRFCSFSGKHQVVTSLPRPCGGSRHRTRGDERQCSCGARESTRYPTHEENPLAMEFTAVNEGRAVGGTGPAVRSTSRRAGSTGVIVALEVRTEID